MITRSRSRALARVSVRKTALGARYKHVPVARCGDVSVARRGHVPNARRGNKPVRLPRSTQVARSNRAVCVRGPAALFGCDDAVYRRPSVSDGAVSSGRLGRGTSLSPLAATGSRIKSLSHARRAGAAERPSASGDVFCFAGRDAEEPKDAPEGFQGGLKPNPKPFQGGGG